MFFQEKTIMPYKCQNFKTKAPDGGILVYFFSKNKSLQLLIEINPVSYWTLARVNRVLRNMDFQNKWQNSPGCCQIFKIRHSVALQLFQSHVWLKVSVHEINIINDFKRKRCLRWSLQELQLCWTVSLTSDVVSFQVGACDALQFGNQ